jgi:hypothetical protein
LITVWGSYYCTSLLRVNRANNALIELGWCLAILFFRNESVQQYVPGAVSKYARAGEQRVEKGKAVTQQQLEELNGPTVPLPRKPAPSSRIGERAPQRDPVGESENLTNPLPPSKCPISNQMVDLDFHLFTQSAVVHVECPTCGSVRKGTLKKNHIIFPPHEKLRSRSTHQGSRWLKHEEEWTISSPASQ